METKFYGPSGRPHHIWCNYFPKYGPCKMCDRLYQKYPIQERDTEDDLMKRHFPNARTK